MTTEFVIGILTSELPFDGSFVGVSCLLPSVYFGLQQFSTGDPSIQALPAQDADLDLRHVQPTRMLWRVVELDSAQQLGSRTLSHDIVERLAEVGVQVVQNQVNAACLGIGIGQQITDERNEVDLAPLSR